MRAGMTLSVSYIGRAARSLLLHRDVTAFNNIRDPKSGMTWYEAGTISGKTASAKRGYFPYSIHPVLRQSFPGEPGWYHEMLNPIVQSDCGTDPSTPCFDPAWTPTQTFYGLQSRGNGDNPFAFFRANDWTDAQAYIDSALFRNGFPTRFMQPQYGSLAAWSTIGNSKLPCSYGLAATAPQLV